jgi:hypothetical protein
MAATPPTDAPRRRSRPWGLAIAWLVALLASLASVALRQAVPFTIAGGAVDDKLYLRTATYLADHAWLGPFDQYTLVKGPAYPAFIAAIYRVGIPLQIGEQLTHLVAAAAVAMCVWTVLRRPVVALAAYTVLALDSTNFDTWSSRATRDTWYASITMLLVALVFLAVYSAVARARLGWVVGYSILAAITAAAFTLCREEPAWIVPTLGVILVGLPAAVAGRWLLRKPRSRVTPRALAAAGGRLALVAGIVLGGALASSAAVAGANQRHYGAPVTSDLVYGTFGRMYADWRRVDGGVSTPTDPITAEQRRAVYGVSPAARQLAPYLDPAGGCRSPADAGFGFDAGIAACTFPVWRGIRTAAAELGYFDTGADAQRFFGQLDAEIQAGCASGQLRCSPRLPTSMQSLQLFELRPFLSFMQTWTWRTALSRGYFDLPPGHRSRVGTTALRATLGRILRDVPTTVPEAQAQVDALHERTWPYDVLFAIYRALLPALVVAGAVGAIMAIVRPRWPRSTLCVLSLACLVGALSRIAFVALLTITAFRTGGIEVRYLLPAHILLLASGVVGSCLLVDRRERTTEPREEVPTPEPASEPVSDESRRRPTRGA